MKKFISMALALMMTLSLCAVLAAPEADAAFADAEDLSSQYAEQAADVIQKIEVMDGYDDGTFRPDAGLTRQAAAKIICNMILGPTTAKALPTNANPFPDVLAGNQFSGYVSYCSQQGIISGYADGTFRPGDPLSGYAYLKMLLGALGYDARHEGFVGDNWKVNVAKIALGIGLNKGIVEDLDGATQVTREAAAIYAFNTLQADMVEYESKNTIEINGVQVSMGGGNAVPQTWGTSNTNGDNINAATDDGSVNGRPIVQFAERYFDKLERIPNGEHYTGAILTSRTNGRDEYAAGDFGRPSVIWYWKGAKIGTYQRDTSLPVYHGNVSANTIYNDLKMTTERWAQVWFNGRDAGQVRISKGNGDDINDQTASNATMTGASNIMKDKIGDGTLIEVYHNDANNDVTVCIMNVWAGKVSSIKGATASKNERVVLDVGNWDEDDASRGDNHISKPKNIDADSERREYELPDGQEGTYEEDDVVAYVYDEADNEIKDILYTLSPEEGTLTRRYADKSIVVDGSTYKYAKNISFDFRAGLDPNDNTKYRADENYMSNKSDYIVYLDEDGLALWIEESEFSDDQYVLIERIYLENSAVSQVLSATLSNVTNLITTTTNIDTAHSAPRAYLRFTSGAAREVSLNESENYRLNDTTISPDYFPGQIVRYSTTSDGDYKLKATASIAYTGVKANGDADPYAVQANTLKGFTYTDSKNVVRDIQADSNTKFIVNDNGTYKTYTGVRNAPNISNVTFGRAYCKDNLAKVVYLNSTNVEGTSNDIVFLAAPSVSKRIDDDDFAPHFEYNAVVKNDITTVRVAYYANAASSGARLTIGGITTGSDKKSECILINEAKYDGDDVLKSGRFVTSTGARGIMNYTAQGIKRVSGSIEDIKLDTANTEISKTFSDSVRVYFSNGDGEIEEIYVEDIRTDSNDYVYYVEESGEITYMFIQEVGDDDDTTPAPAAVTYAPGTLNATNAAGTAFTLHLLPDDTATDTSATGLRDMLYANTSYKLTATNYLRYNATASSANLYVYDWIENGVESGIQISLTVAKDASEPEQPEQPANQPEQPSPTT